MSKPLSKEDRAIAMACAADPDRPIYPFVPSYEATCLALEAALAARDAELAEARALVRDILDTRLTCDENGGRALSDGLPDRISAFLEGKHGR